MARSGAPVTLLLSAEGLKQLYDCRQYSKDSDPNRVAHQNSPPFQGGSWTA
jgi:hypothetical protein